MENPRKWYSRKGMDAIGCVLIVIGTCATLMFFPTLPFYSLLLLALIAGPGVFISYKQESTRETVGFGFLISLISYFIWLAFLSGIWEKLGDMISTFAFIFDFVTKVVPIVIFGTIISFWASGKFLDRGLTRKGLRLAELKKSDTWVALFLVMAFVSLGMLDYNVRGDTSLPEVITMKVVSRHWDENSGNTLRVDSPDRGLSFTLAYVSSGFYNLHDIGSLVYVTVRRGALGYPYVEGYGAALPACVDCSPF